VSTATSILFAVGYAVIMATVILGQQWWQSRKHR